MHRSVISAACHTARSPSEDSLLNHDDGSIHNCAFCINCDFRAEIERFARHGKTAANLGNDGHVGAQVLEAHLGNVNTIDDDAAAVELLQPEQAVDERALAGSRAANYSTSGAGRHRH